MYDAESLVERSNQLVDDVLEGHWGFEHFISTYPTQSYYFDKLYKIRALVNTMNQLRDLLSLEMDVETSERSKAYFYVYSQSTSILEIAEELCNVYKEVEYYSKSKAWTWRIFVPLVRN